MKRNYALALAAMAPIGVLVGMYLMDRSRRDAELKELHRKVSELSSIRSVAAGDEHTNSLWRTAAPTQAEPAPAPVRPASADTTRPLPSVEAKPVPQPPEIRDNLQVAFLADRTAPKDWGGESRRVAIERLTNVLPPGSAVESFECHETFCRIETRHPDLPRYTQFARAAFLNSSTQIWNAPVFLTRQNDEAPAGAPLLMVAYIAQPGQKLPEL